MRSAAFGGSAVPPLSLPQSVSGPASSKAWAASGTGPETQSGREPPTSSTRNPFQKPLLRGGAAGDLVNVRSSTYTMQALHSDDNVFLPPSFAKVTKTPWTASAKVMGGYGRRVFMTSVSKDAPRFFQIQRVVGHKRQMYAPREKRALVDQRGGAVSKQAPEQFNTRFRRCVESGDVPLRAAGLKMLTDKQTIFEPMSTRRSVSTIDWGGL